MVKQILKEHSWNFFNYFNTYSRFFVKVGHEITYTFIRNHHFFTISCHYQTYQNHTESRQKLEIFSENWFPCLIFFNEKKTSEMFCRFSTLKNDLENLILVGLTMTWFRPGICVKYFLSFPQKKPVTREN